MFGDVHANGEHGDVFIIIMMGKHFVVNDEAHRCASSLVCPAGQLHMDEWHTLVAVHAHVLLRFTDPVCPLFGGPLHIHLLVCFFFYNVHTFRVYLGA